MWRGWPGRSNEFSVKNLGNENIGDLEKILVGRTTLGRVHGRNFIMVTLPRKEK
jgi:hypothetical protein